MTVHIDSITSEVVTDREPGDEQSVAEGSSSDQEAEHWRALRERVRRDAIRTRAEGYDAA